jgi:hypothetical protein
MQTRSQELVRIFGGGRRVGMIRSARLGAKLRLVRKQRIFEAAHCATSLSVFASTGFVMRSVPTMSRRPGRPGSAISGAGPARHPSHAADSRPIRAIGCAHRPLSGFTGCPNTGGLDVPRTGRRGRQVGAIASRFEGRRFSSNRGPAALGPQREGAHGIPIRPGKHGQKPLVDVVSRRRLLQSRTSRDGRYSSDASPSARSRQSQLLAATKRNYRSGHAKRKREPRRVISTRGVKQLAEAEFKNNCRGPEDPKTWLESN